MKRWFLFVASVTVLSLAACSSESVTGEADEELGEEADTAEGAATTAIRFTPIEDRFAQVPDTPARKVFTTERAYRSFFSNERGPVPVNFSRDSVVFYGAGMKNNGGYSASIAAVSRSQSGKSLRVTTSLVAPGPDCFTTQAFENVFAFAKFPKQATVRNVSFASKDSTRSCRVDPCATARCPSGTRCNASGGSALCEMVTTQCMRMLCAEGTRCVEKDGKASCVPDDPCARVRCPGGTKCLAAGATTVCEKVKGGCTTVADCTLSSNYCGGCSCDALGFNEAPERCSGNQVACFVDPCGSKTAACVNGMCEAK